MLPLADRFRLRHVPLRLPLSSCASICCRSPIAAALPPRRRTAAAALAKRAAAAGSRRSASAMKKAAANTSPAPRSAPGRSPARDSIAGTSSSISGSARRRDDPRGPLAGGDRNNRAGGAGAVDQAGAACALVLAETSASHFRATSIAARAGAAPRICLRAPLHSAHQTLRRQSRRTQRARASAWGSRARRARDAGSRCRRGDPVRSGRPRRASAGCARRRGRWSAAWWCGARGGSAAPARCGRARAAPRSRGRRRA